MNVAIALALWSSAFGKVYRRFGQLFVYSILREGDPVE